MKTETLAALILHSPDPAALAAFYRDALGIPFAPHSHGPTRVHQEAFWNGVHFAIWASSARPGGTIVPVFRVGDLDGAVGELNARGVAQLHPPIDLGEGKRVVSFTDPDGNQFRLIEVAAVWPISIATKMG